MKIAVINILLLMLFQLMSGENSQVDIVDSDMTFEEAVKGSKAPKSVIDSLCLLNVRYYSTDGKIHSGQLVINKSVKNDVEYIFSLMFEKKFPVRKVVPIVKYGWSDDKSMDDNNTSAFCYRFVAGTTRLSNHSFGRAVDINPFFNPVIHKNGRKSPSKAKYDKNKPGTFHKEHFFVREFKRLGWRWGGEFSQYADKHHFDK